MRLVLSLLALLPVFGRTIASRQIGCTATSQFFIYPLRISTNQLPQEDDSNCATAYVVRTEARLWKPSRLFSLSLETLRKSRTLRSVVLRAAEKLLLADLALRIPANQVQELPLDMT